MMDKLKKINKAIRKSGLKNSTDFLNAFLDREDEILSLFTNFSGIKSEIYLKEINNELTNLIKFSSLFSDITILNTSPSSSKQTNVTSHDLGSKYFQERKLTIPQEYIPETGVDPKRFRPCYIHRIDSETKTLFQNYAPLIKNDRLLIRPLRGLWVNFQELNQGTLYFVDPNTTNEHWYINKIQQMDSITIDNGYLSYSNVTDLFEITLPYFKDIDLITFTKILNDENDILVEFRNNISKLIKEAGGDLRRIEEIKKDIMFSSIERLNRKFKAIQNQHRANLATSLSYFILTLSTGNIDIANVLKSFASLLPMGVSEYNYQKGIIDLKDNPYYLLWKIKSKQ